MKIGILLPYKENFSPEYPGAVSLFVNETCLNSKYKKNIIVFGNTNYKKRYDLKYININLSKNPLISQTKTYVNKFIKLQKSCKIESCFSFWEGCHSGLFIRTNLALMKLF